MAFLIWPLFIIFSLACISFEKDPVKFSIFFILGIFILFIFARFFLSIETFNTFGLMIFLFIGCSIIGYLGNIYLVFLWGAFALTLESVGFYKFIYGYIGYLISLFFSLFSRKKKNKHSKYL